MVKKRHSINAKHGAGALRMFLDKHGLTLEAAATELHTTKASVSLWLLERVQPRAEWRIAIERWTRGLVSQRLWLSKDDQALIAEVKPHRGKA